MDPVTLAWLHLLIWVIFAAAAALATCLGALLAYHWFRYAMNPAMSSTALIIYAGITFFLITGLFATTIAIVVTI